MDRKKLLVGVTPLLFTLILLVVLTQLNALADDEGTRSPGVYVGSDACMTCHSEQYDGWNATLHPNSWDTLIVDPLKQEECEHCHVTGYDDVVNGGFDPATDLPVEMRGTQCEACHGPGEDHVNSGDPVDTQVNLSARVCGAICHQEEHHPYYEEWNQSGHSLSLISLRGAAGAAEDACLECHSADYILNEEPDRPSIATAEFAITCSVCHDPHNITNPYQLRWPKDELCERCHYPDGAIPGDPIYHPQSSMRDGRSGAPILGEAFMPDVECADCHIYMDMSDNITGHSFTQKPEACVECHQTTPPIYSVELAEIQIAQWRTQTWTRIIDVQQVVVRAEGAIEDAPNYGFPESTLQVAADLYNEANYSFSFVVADGSGGAHNPAFASALLNFSEDRSNELIALLTPGTVRGRVVDAAGSPVEGVTIEKDGVTWATSKKNGSFEFEYAPGAHSFSLKLRGSNVGSIESVTVVAGEISDIGDLEVTEQDLFVPIMISIGVIIILSVIVAYLLLKIRGLRSKKEES
ncbi:MAG: ammonia-forming cytochrome c nitrite reductase subunit c552 [Candidatus Thermoplasmatota archaeon]|nr:ammonia-forming cytochrome c nitrite reductase subunit c552 [Candidatus Thermoplasmatota archaeon]